MYDIEKIAEIEKELKGWMLKDMYGDGYGNIIIVFVSGMNVKLFRIKNNYYTGLDIMRTAGSYTEVGGE